MLLELTAVIAGINTATATIKKCAEAGQDLSSIAGMISKLGESEVQIAKLQNSGRLSQEDALKAVLAKKELQDRMAEIKDLFIVSGNSHLWVEMLQNMAEARIAEQNRTRAEIQRKKKLRKDVMEIIVITGFTILMIPIVIFIMIQLLR